jgi:glucose/arabinose dehydrogenase
MMRKVFGVFAILVATSAAAVVSGETVVRSALHDFRLVAVADALIQPWGIAFLPGGDVLITERPGRLRIVRNGRLLPQAVEGVPAVFHSNQGGLFEVMPHPNFASNRLLYLTYAKPGADESLSRTIG